MKEIHSLDLKPENGTFFNKDKFCLELKEKTLRKKNMKSLNIFT